MTARIVLKKGKTKSIERRHPWIFSGAIASVEGQPQEGDWVAVVAPGNTSILAMGFYEEEGSIRVRILCFSAAEDAATIVRQHIHEAVHLRKSLGYFQDPRSNACRLVFGEGDRLPGLIVDYYDGVAVMQAHTWGMYRQRDTIARALETALAEIRSIYDASHRVLPRQWQAEAQPAFLKGTMTGAVPVKEHGQSFLVDFIEGQKTGFFLDQRDNRALLNRYAKDRTVLNTFSYTGGFTISAATGGAKRVDSVDSSRPALQMLSQNLGLNELRGEQFGVHRSDVFAFLGAVDKGKYDCIVLDPPAFAKHQRARHQALMAYKRLNLIALQKIAAGGILFTFSCSQVVDRMLFERTIMAAAIEAGRPVRILHHLTQPADHPVNIYHPEGQYLKGMVLEVD